MAAARRIVAGRHFHWRSTEAAGRPVRSRAWRGSSRAGRVLADRIDEPESVGNGWRREVIRRVLSGMRITEINPKRGPELLAGARYFFDCCRHFLEPGSWKPSSLSDNPGDLPCSADVLQWIGFQ